MMGHKSTNARILIIWGIYATIMLIFLTLIGPRAFLWNKKTEHKVYISLGFHVNMKHSFRIDTNDESGFGKDIRIIRKILTDLDEFQDIPAVWDFDNLFTLEKILPKYAPDILAKIKSRVGKGQDEIILMSYNNGLASALNRQELTDSIRLAVQNPQGSGVVDLFSKYSPIVRPQEMMTTPGSFSIYKENGIKSILLYYSGITFDAFRNFISPLSLEEAHNPLLFENAKLPESIIVIPCYNVGDIIDHVSLRNWAEKLHRAQLRGEIKKDVLIAINFDADDSFWYGYNVSAMLKLLPNTGGLRQLIQSVQDLPYVRMTRLQDYIDAHHPVKKIFFSQDTADGSFNGNSSWSEKAYSSDFWSVVVNGRRLHQIVHSFFTKKKSSPPRHIKRLLDEEYSMRLTLLSTTNFGMATPFLARQRELDVLHLMRGMRQKQKEIQQMMTLLLTDRMEIQGEGGYKEVYFLDKDYRTDENFLLFFSKKSLPVGGFAFIQSISNPLMRFRARVVSSFYLEKTGRFRNRLFFETTSPGAGRYSLSLSDVQAEATKWPILNNRAEFLLKKMRIVLDPQKKGVCFYMNGKEVIAQGSLLPAIHYRRGWQSGTQIKIETVSYRKDEYLQFMIRGNLDLGEFLQLEKGTFVTQITALADFPFFIVDSRISYPNTRRMDAIKKELPALARFVDFSWVEVAPVPLYIAMEASAKYPFQIEKINYLGIESEYAVTYYELHKGNKFLSNLNNHITASFLGVKTRNDSVYLAMDTTISPNFSFAPLKIVPGKQSNSQAIWINPGGTYFGSQWSQPTFGNGLGYKAAFITGQQYSSSAPTYNGYKQNISMMVFLANHPKRKKLLKKFAEPISLILDGEDRFELLSDYFKLQESNGKPEPGSASNNLALPLSLQLKIIFATIISFLD